MLYRNFHSEAIQNTRWDHFYNFLYTHAYYQTKAPMFHCWLQGHVLHCFCKIFCSNHRPHYLHKQTREYFCSPCSTVRFLFLLLQLVDLTNRMEFSVVIVTKVLYGTSTKVLIISVNEEYMVSVTFAFNRITEKGRLFHYILRLEKFLSFEHIFRGNVPNHIVYISNVWLLQCRRVQIFGMKNTEWFVLLPDCAPISQFFSNWKLSQKLIHFLWIGLFWIIIKICLFCAKRDIYHKVIMY